MNKICICLIFVFYIHSSHAIYGGSRPFRPASSSGVVETASTNTIEANGSVYFLEHKVVYEKDLITGQVSNLEGLYTSLLKPSVKSIHKFHGEIIALEKKGALWIWKRNQRRWMLLERKVEQVSFTDRKLVIIKRGGQKLTYDDSLFCKDQLFLRKNYTAFKSRFKVEQSESIIKRLVSLNPNDNIKMKIPQQDECNCNEEENAQRFCKINLTDNENYNTINFVLHDENVYYIDGGSVYQKQLKPVKTKYLKSRRGDAMSLHIYKGTLVVLHKDGYLFKWHDGKNRWDRVSTGVRKIKVIGQEMVLSFFSKNDKVLTKL